MKVNPPLPDTTKKKKKVKDEIKSFKNYFEKNYNCNDLPYQIYLSSNKIWKAFEYLSTLRYNSCSPQKLNNNCQLQHRIRKVSGNGMEGMTGEEGSSKGRRQKNERSGRCDGIIRWSLGMIM